MAEAEVITPMEQHQSFTYLQEYLQLGRGLLPHAAVDLTEAFCTHPASDYYTCRAICLQERLSPVTNDL
jgi:hypothetical protein